MHRSDAKRTIVKRGKKDRREARIAWRLKNLPRSQRIHARREELEITTREAASRAKIPHGTWKGYESGWNPVPAHRLEAVASALKCSIDWLVTGREAKRKRGRKA